MLLHSIKAAKALYILLEMLHISYGFAGQGVVDVILFWFIRPVIITTIWQVHILRLSIQIVEHHITTYHEFATIKQVPTRSGGGVEH